MTPTLGLKGKTVLYTGAAGLIGSSASLALAQHGAELVLIDVDGARLVALKDKIETEVGGARVRIISDMDMGDPAQVDVYLDAIVTECGSIDCLINSAYPRTDDWHLSFEKIPYHSWQKNIDQHLNGYFNMSQRTALKMQKQGAGNIINFGSIYGMVGPDFSVYAGLDGMTMPAAYAAIKGGIVNFTRYMAAYLGPYNIRVNCICPGGVINHQDPRFIAAYEQKVPMRRMATVDDVVKPLLFLASNMSAYVTGVILPVDGGWTAI